MEWYGSDLVQTSEKESDQSGKYKPMRNAYRIRMGLYGSGHNQTDEPQSDRHEIDPKSLTCFGMLTLCQRKWKEQKNKRVETNVGDRQITEMDHNNTYTYGA